MSDVLDTLMTVLDEEHALAVIEYRRVTKKAKLTAFAAKLLAKRFAEWGDANEAAEIMIERCWQGFQASWVRDRYPTRRTNMDAAQALIERLQNEPGRQDQIHQGHQYHAEQLPYPVRH